MLLRRALLPLTATAGAASVVLLIQPLNSGLLRLGLLGSVALFLVGLLLLAWPYRTLRVALLVLVAAVAAVAILPGRPPEPASLRARYLAALNRYLHVPYVWGGEGATGIDCSGLPRRALRDAYLAEALATANPALLRAALSNWWFDASAASLAQGYRGQTTPVGEAGVLLNNAFVNLEPGDVAVTRSGVHCLVHLGEQLWIQADLGVGRVEIFDARQTANGWFVTPVTLHRWTALTPR